MFRKTRMLMEQVQALQTALDGIEAKMASSIHVETVQESVTVLSTRLDELKGRIDTAMLQTQEGNATLAGIRERIDGVADEVAASTNREMDKLAEALSTEVRRMLSEVNALPSIRAIEPIQARVDELAGKLESAKASFSEIGKLLEANRQLLDKVDMVYKDQKAVTDDSNQWRQQVVSVSQQKLTEVKRALDSVLAEEHRISKSVQNADVEIKTAVENVGKQLTSILAEYINKEVGPRVDAVSERLDRLISRLEARGASNFKTAQAKILENLRKKNILGGKHIPWDNALTSLSGPEREVGKEALEDLVRRGLVIKKPAGYGDQVFLNKDRKAEIDRVINGEDE